MFLKNNSARLVTINRKDGEPIQIKPGDNPAVEVPDALTKKGFVHFLIKERVLIQEAAPLVDVDGDGDTDEELAALQAEALSLGMEFKDTWALSTLKGKISKFKKDNE